jgi:Ca-activated chloride channel homolog
MLAHRARTSIPLAGAAGTLLAALLLSPPTQRGEDVAKDVADDGIRLEARLVSEKLLPGTLEHDLAVTITVPEGHGARRPAVSLAIVIDRSGSMTDSELATPLADARAAAARLIEQLTPRDAFAIVTYSDGDETVSPMTRATPEARRAARTALATIEAVGGTCIACGIARGASELGRSPVAGGLARMVVISDGQATLGLSAGRIGNQAWRRDDVRDELVRLAAETAATGVSITTVGVGLEFDEVVMAELASVGRGNYHFVEDTQRLEGLFTHELAELGRTIAADVRLIVAEEPGVRIEGAYGYPFTRSGSHVIIPIADLRAGETRKVVLRVAMESRGLGERLLARLELGWRRVGDGAPRRATTTARTEVIDDAAEVTASIDPATVALVEQARTGHALEEASQVLEAHGRDAALAVLARRATQLRHAGGHLRADLRARLERANADAADMLHKEPTRAVKVNRVHAYELTR